MWIFNYFSITFLTSSLLSLGYDLLINRYKQKNRSPSEILECISYMWPTIAFNMVCINYPYFYLAVKYIEKQERNEMGLLWNCIATFMIADFGTYAMHRLFHAIPFLYKHFHKVHHEFVYPIGLGALYAHPVDYLVVNLIPMTSSIFLLHPDDFSIKFITIVFVAVTVIQAHGGYTFLDKSHLLHHVHYKVNYGMGLSDHVFRTAL